MSPRSREETKQLLTDALVAIKEQPEEVKKELLESSGWVELLFDPSPTLFNRLNDYFEWCDGKKEENPGELLEEIAYLIFKSFVGVGNVRSFQSFAPQHDLVVDGETNNWLLLLNYLHLPESGRSIVVECKNQNASISDQQFSRLCSILQNKFQNTAHLGVFISRTSASGFPSQNSSERSLRNSRATQALFHAKTNKYVIVVAHDDLVKIKNGANIAKIFEAKIREVEASAGVTLEFNEDWEEVLLPRHLAKYQSSR